MVWGPFPISAVPCQSPMSPFIFSKSAECVRAPMSYPPELAGKGMKMMLKNTIKTNEINCLMLLPPLCLIDLRPARIPYRKVYHLRSGLERPKYVSHRPQKRYYAD